MLGTRRHCIVETNAVPLIDRKSFIGVHEPRDVTKPIEIDGHGTIAQKETTEQQQGDDEGRTYGQSNSRRASHARDHVTWKFERGFIIVIRKLRVNSLPKDVATLANRMTIPQAIKNLPTSGFNPIA